jgi:hypothetical protein
MECELLIWNLCGNIPSFSKSKARHGRTEGMSMSKCVAIVQSNYIPWKGYFDLINSADEFILYDDVQYTTRDWRNRNRIKTKKGLMWLSVPVQTSGKRLQKIRETVVADSEWTARHWKAIITNYARTDYFKSYGEVFKRLYAEMDEKFLSRINYRFIEAICRVLGITTKISWSMDYNLTEGKTERLVGLCSDAGATEYLSGPAAKAYLDERLFTDKGIKVTYYDYSGYPEYKQLFPPFVHEVSIMDLIFNVGPNAPKYMKSF